MSEATGNLIETVEFRAVAPKADLRGLDTALHKLDALDSALKTVQNRLAGLTTGSTFKLSAAQFAAKVPTSGPQDLRKLIKVWGFPDAKDVLNVAREVEGELQRSIERIQRKLDKAAASPARGSTAARDALRAQIKELKAQSLFTDPSATTLRNPARAGRFAELYAQRALVNKGNAEKAILGLLSGTVTASGGNAAPFQFPVQPPIAPVTKAKKSKAGGTPADGAPEEESESAKAKAARTAAGKFADALEKIKLQLAQDLNTGDLEKVSGARHRAADQVKGLVEADSEGKIKQRTKDKALRYAAEQERQSVEASQKFLVQAGDNVFQLRKKLAAAEKVGQREKAKQLKAEIAVEEARIAGMKALDRVFYAPQARQQQQRAAAAAKVTAFDAKRAAGLDRVRQVGSAWQEFLASGGVATHDEMIMGKGGMRRELRGENKLPNGQTRVFSASIGEADARLRSYAKTTKEAKQETNWLGSDFLTNTAKVAKWSLSVGLLYKTLGLAKYSFSTFLTASGQVARLEQIFRQVGGTTMELTSDILHLAAVTGRSGEEAMESAISWSRLGLSRVQVNEAVRLSLVAANVTQLSAAETTEHLQAITQNYGLSLSQLASKLGELNQISNVYNVTNADLLQGVSRSAALAKQAGMSFEELLGLIGATVGATKQTGANIGNAIKTIITSLGSPQLQEKLRLLYGIQSEGRGGHAKAVTDVLDQIYIRYQKLDALQQRTMTFSISGKFQSQRLSAMLDNYVRAQVLAIDAQLHLNTAEQENLKIVGSLKSQLTGLSAEWERFVVLQGSNGPAQALGEISKALKNVIGLMNTKGGSLLTTLLLGVGTAAVAKTALTAMTVKSGAAGGWIGATQQQALLAAMALNGFTNQSMKGFYDRSLAGNKEALAGRYSKYRAQYPTMTAGQAFALAGGPAQAGMLASGLMGMNNFGNARLAAAAKAFKDIRLAAAGANAMIGLTVKSLALASAALVEFALPIALIVGGIWLFNKAMDAMEGHAEASRKRLAGFNDEMERTAAAARAMGGAAKLFDVAIQTFSPMPGYGAMPQKNANRMLDQLKEAMFLNEPDLEKRGGMQAKEVERLKGLYKTGDVGGINTALSQQRENYFQAQSDRLQENFEAKKRKAEELAAQYAKLQKMQNGEFDNSLDKAWSAVAGGDAKRRQLMIDLEKQQAEVNGEVVQSYQEREELQEAVLSTDQKVTAELGKQKALLEAVAAVFGSIHTTNPMEKWTVDMTVAQAKLMALGKQREQILGASQGSAAEQALLAQKGEQYQAQEDAARAQLGKLNASQAQAEGDMKLGVDEPAAWGRAYRRFDALGVFQKGENHEQAKSRLKSQIELLRKRRDNLKEGIDDDNPGMVSETARNQKLLANNQQQIQEAKNALAAIQVQKAMVERQTRFELGQQRADRNLGGQAYGNSEGDRLIRERKYLTADIASLEQQINAALTSGADAMELRGRLAQDLYLRQKDTLDLLKRQQDVERDIRQLKIDQNKEFMKSFMGAGPAEMLQKLSAFRMAFDNKGQRRSALSQGAFFGLSPEMRGNYGQLNPQFNPQMMLLKQEREQIKQAILEAFGSLNPKNVDKGLMDQSGVYGKAIEGLKDAAVAALEASASAVENASTRVARSLEALSEKIDRVLTNVPTAWSAALNLPQTAQAGGLGGGRGFTK